jgi:hypothetical protein
MEKAGVIGVSNREREQQIKNNLLACCGISFNIRTAEASPYGTYLMGRPNMPKFMLPIRVNVGDEIYVIIENSELYFYDHRTGLVNFETVMKFRMNLSLSCDGPLNGEIICAMIAGHRLCTDHAWGSVFAGDRIVMLWRWFNNTRGGYGLVSDLIHIVAEYLAE